MNYLWGLLLVLVLVGIYYVMQEPSSPYAVDLREGFHWHGRVHRCHKCQHPIEAAYKLLSYPRESYQLSGGDALEPNKSRYLGAKVNAESFGVWDSSAGQLSTPATDSSTIMGYEEKMLFGQDLPGLN